MTKGLRRSTEPNLEEPKKINLTIEDSKDPKGSIIGSTSSNKAIPGKFPVSLSFIFEKTQTEIPKSGSGEIP